MPTSIPDRASTHAPPVEDDRLDLEPIEPPTWWDELRGSVLVERPVRILAGLVGLLVAVATLWVLVRPEAPRAEDVIPMAAPASAPPELEGGPDLDGVVGAPGQPVATSAPDPARILVHAAGAVRSPGLYELADGARVADLVAAAGGGRDDADLDRLNLAEPLVDGSRVEVPVVGEEIAGPLVTGPGAAGVAGSGSPTPATAPALVDLNTATAAELESLPGVGPATAQAILDHRAANGPFTSVDGLLDVRGIGEAKLAALRDLVRVG